MASTLDTVLSEIAEIQRSARGGQDQSSAVADDRPRSPKGWTGPAVVDGKVEAPWRSHQVPLSETHSNREHAKLLEQWLKSYRPAELFDADGTPKQDLLDMAPDGSGGCPRSLTPTEASLLRQLVTPNWMEYCVDVQAPAQPSTSRPAFWEVSCAMSWPRIARLPTSASSVPTRRIPAVQVLEVTGKAWGAEILREEWDSS